MGTTPDAMVSLPESLSGLEPSLLWQYFHQLTQIPRESGNETAAIAHVIAWADAHGFSHEVDDGGNLCVKVPGTSGHESDSPVCVQGHIDMVAEKAPEKAHNFEIDPITPVRHGDVLKADKTTLGADNGIGVAAAMAVSTDPEAVHPPLELLFTTDEERGFVGTFKLNPAKLGLTANQLINLDNEQLGETGIQSAGLIMATGAKGIERENSAPAEKGPYYRFTFTNLPGGHSAKDIDKGIPNAIKAMAKLLRAQKSSVRLVSINGGERINGIPITCEAVVFVPENERVNFLAQIFGEEAMSTIQPHKGKIRMESLLPEEVTCTAMTEQTHWAVLAALDEIKSGVDKIHPDFPAIPFTSRNLGTVRTNNAYVQIGYSVRSPSAEEIGAVHSEVDNVLTTNGFTTAINFQIPTWNADRNSSLVAAVNQAYGDVAGKPAVLGATHGGLEAGVLAQILAAHLGSPVDTVTFGPEIHKPHSPSEEVEIPSVNIFYRQLRRTLELLASREAT